MVRVSRRLCAFGVGFRTLFPQGFVMEPRPKKPIGNDEFRLRQTWQSMLHPRLQETMYCLMKSIGLEIFMSTHAVILA